MAKTLVITNDFPPKRGGIEGFVAAITARFDPGDVIVYTSSAPGDRAHDAAVPYRVVRDRSRLLLPTPRVRRQATALLRAEGCSRVLFGASAPLAMLAGAMRAAGAERIVAVTHSVEPWWARVPGTRQALRRMGRDSDVMTYLNSWSHRVIGGALAPVDRVRMRPLHPGADPEVFHPDCGGGEVRRRLGIAPEVPVIVCAARLVPGKGHDTLVRALRQVREVCPTARLLLVGDGPKLPGVLRLARRERVADAVTSVGSVGWQEVAAYIDAGTIFAMPSRSRYGGLKPEGLPLCYLEAAACGKPVIAGRSGGAHEAIEDEVTGFVVDPRDPSDVARRIVALVADPERAKAMGERGRARVLESWTWDAVAASARDYLGYGR